MSMSQNMPCAYFLTDADYERAANFNVSKMLALALEQRKALALPTTELKEPPKEVFQ